MGRTIPVLLLRISTFVCAGLLLFAVFTRAHADAYGDDTYGLAPLPPASPAAAATATAFGGAPQVPSPAPAAKQAGADTALSSSPSAGQSDDAGHEFVPGIRGSQDSTGNTSTGVKPVSAISHGYGQDDGEPAHTAPGPAVNANYQPPSRSADSDTRPDPDYVLGTGDKIHLTVFDEADLSGDFMVDGSGFVRLPLIGQVRAAGYTPPQLETAVAAALAKGYLRAPRVSVEVTTYRPFYVVGAVGRPGEYPYVNHMTVLNAIAIAGGFLPSAVESVVYVRPQGGAQEYRVRTDGATMIHPGDVVRVETTFFWDAMSLFAPMNGVASIAVAGIR
jgi:polysaccharide export outer membrane protein